MKSQALRFESIKDVVGLANATANYTRIPVHTRGFRIFGSQVKRNQTTATMVMRVRMNEETNSGDSPPPCGQFYIKSKAATTTTSRNARDRFNES